jgi:SAM-dependent methyltransferase
MEDRGWHTDKVSLGYLPVYERIKGDLEAAFPAADRPLGAGSLKILEVGVAGGGGMAMLRDVFETTDVWGVDIGPKAGGLDDQNNILFCSQDDPGLPLVLANIHGSFHLIVDDASHLAGLTSVTLANLWTLVKPGGFYVIEDWNYLEAAGMAQNLWQKIFGWWLAYPSVDLRGKPQPPYSGMLEGIADVLIRDGMIVLRKVR